MHSNTHLAKHQDYERNTLSVKVQIFPAHASEAKVTITYYQENAPEQKKKKKKKTKLNSN